MLLAIFYGMGTRQEGDRTGKVKREVWVMFVEKYLFGEIQVKSV